MDLNEYQAKAHSTAIYNPEAGLTYTALGLAGEVGEISEKLVTYLFGDEEVTYPPLSYQTHFWLTQNAEIGKNCEKLKKAIRDKGDWKHIVTPEGIADMKRRAEKLSNEQKLELKKELGDVQWYIAELAYVLGFELDDVATGNNLKLAARQQTNALSGNGDNR